MQTQKKNSSIKYITMNFQKTSQKNNSKEDQNFDNSNDLILRKTPKQSIQSYIYLDRKLRVKQFQRLKKNRARLMDWYLQVYCIFQLSWSSYWYAIELIDTLIADFDYIRVENVHIVGIVCCFLSAKMMEGNTLALQDLYDRIGHRKFSKQLILQQEGRIVNLIFSSSSQLTITVYSYLREKCINIPNTFLKKGLEMLVLAFMKPEKSFSSLRVRTYRQVVHYIMTQIMQEKSIPVLEEIRKEIKLVFEGQQNVSSFAKQMRL